MHCNTHSVDAHAAGVVPFAETTIAMYAVPGENALMIVPPLEEFTCNVLDAVFALTIK